MQHKVTALTRTGFTEAYAVSLSVNYVLDLEPINMVLARYTLFCHDDLVCQIIFKSHDAGRSYERT